MIRVKFRASRRRVSSLRAPRRSLVFPPRWVSCKDHLERHTGGFTAHGPPSEALGRALIDLDGGERKAEGIDESLRPPA